MQAWDLRSGTQLYELRVHGVSTSDGHLLPNGRLGAGPGLCCWFGVEPPPESNGDPSLPSMRGRFTTPFNSFRSHTIALVRGAAEGWVVGRHEAMCSAVSGKSLARTLHGPPSGTSVGAIAGSLDREQTHPWCSAVLRRVRVERRTNCEASSVGQIGVDGRSALEAGVLMWQDERVRWSGRKVGNFGGLGWFEEYGDLAVGRYPTIGLPRALSGLSKPTSGARRRCKGDRRAELWEHE
jgi:hypothetical protein